MNKDLLSTLLPRFLFLILFISLPVLIEAKRDEYNVYKIRGDLLNRNDLAKLDVISSAKNFYYLRLKKSDESKMTSRGIKLSLCKDCYPKNETESKNYDEYILYLEELSKGGILSMETIGESFEGRNIYSFRFGIDSSSPNPDKQDIFLIGLQHAREWTTFKIILQLASYLNNNYEVDERIKNLYNNCELILIPFLNPDGFEYTRTTDSLWRKNRRENSDGTVGVDLNRNYDFEFYSENRITDTSSEQYSGDEPFSEPETQALRELLSQSEAGGLIDFHAHWQMIFYPWAYTKDKSDDDDLFQMISLFFKESIYSYYNEEYGYGQPSNYIGYSVGGSLIDYTYAIYDIPSFAIELRPKSNIENGFYISDEEIEQNFNEIIDSVIKFSEISCKEDWRELDSDIIKKDKDSGGCGFI